MGKNSRFKLWLVFLLAAIAGSVIVNGLLLRRYIACYKELHRLRLNPAEVSMQPRHNNPDNHGQTEHKIIFLGDSRIAQWKELPDVDGWESVNKGIGGQTTAQVLLRLESDVIAEKPSAVIIQIGINDLKTIGLFPDQTAEITNLCINNLAKIVEILNQNDIKAVLMTVWPCSHVGMLRRAVWSEKIQTAVSKVNQWIRDQDNAKAVVIDCDEIFLDGIKVRWEIYTDTLHINADGYKALNSLIIPLIEDEFKSLVP